MSMATINKNIIGISTKFVNLQHATGVLLDDVLTNDIHDYA